MSTWYVVKVMPGKERTLNDQFNTQISLGNLNFVNRFVCPTEKEFVVVRKKKVLREKVIYGGYLYFESEISLTEDQLKTIAAYPSIMGMLGDKRPMLMRNDDVEKILKDEMLEKHKENKIIKYIIGENVTIMDGPFSSFAGTVKAIHNDKVQLNVKVFGRDTLVELNADQITKMV